MKNKQFILKLVIIIFILGENTKDQKILDK